MNHTYLHNWHSCLSPTCLKNVQTSFAPPLGPGRFFDLLCRPACGGWEQWEWLLESDYDWDQKEPVPWWWSGPECWPVPAWGSQLIPECCPIPDCESKLVSKVGLEPKLSLCNPTSISSSPSELECDNLVLSWGAGWREWVPSLSVGEDCCRWAPCWKTPVRCLWGVNSTAAEHLLLEACSWRVAKAVGGGGGFRGGFGCFVWGLDVFFVHLGFAGVSGTTGSS